MEARPLLLFGAAAAIGAVVVQPDVSSRFLLLIVAAAWLVWPARRAENERFRSVAAVALAAGALSASIHLAASRPPVRTHTLRMACTVLDAQTCAGDDGTTISVEQQANLPGAGAHVVLRGRIEAFDAPRNPGDPDERAIERERGIDARMGNARVLAILPAAPLTVTTAIARAHGWALRQLQMRLSEPYPAILAGELWGERATLPPELRTEFQETGTVHILVTAGLHLGVVALVFLSILRYCTVPRTTAAAITVCVVWAYALFSGLHLPSIRAATMVSFALVAYAAGAASRSWNAYGAALLAIAIFWPLSLTGASFALSFSCVGAILLCADDLHRALENVALPQKIREAVSLALATQSERGRSPPRLFFFLRRMRF